MTFGQLNIGAEIERIGETIYVADKQTRQVGVRTVTEFKVVRGCCKDGLWVTAAQVQQWLDAAVSVLNPESEEL